MNEILLYSESCNCKKDEMLCSYVRTTAVRIRHQVSCRAVQRSRLLSKYPAELPSGFSFSRNLRQICASVWGAPKFDNSISQISKHSECTSITVGASKSTWECCCRVWEKFALLKEGPWASWSTCKHRWCRPECLEGMCVASGLIYILRMLWHSWNLCTSLQETSRAAGNAAQLCRRLGAILSQ